jgi:hypothetical protein
MSVPSASINDLGTAAYAGIVRLAASWPPKWEMGKLAAA